MKFYLTVLVTILCSLFVLGTSLSAMAADVPRISKEALKAMANQSDVVIIDVRSSGDWKSSESKITGAIREEPRQAESWGPKYKKDKTYVLYCA